MKRMVICNAQEWNAKLRELEPQYSIHVACAFAPLAVHKVTFHSSASLLFIGDYSRHGRMPRMPLKLKKVRHLRLKRVSKECRFRSVFPVNFFPHQSAPRTERLAGKYADGNQR